MFAEDLFKEILFECLDRLVSVHVLLFVDSLKLALEQTEHRVAETLGIHVHPLAKLVGREGVEIHRLVVGRASVEAGAAHLGEDHVDLIRDGVVGRCE